MGSAEPIRIEQAEPVKRVLLLTHREPAVTESTLPSLLSILDEAGVEVLVPAGEIVKHRLLTGYQSSDRMGLKPGGEDLILVLAEVLLVGLKPYSPPRVG